jgi:hypothetical protein
MIETDLLTKLIEVAKSHGYTVTDFTLENKGRIELGLKKDEEQK